jgi:hypothetical protein
MLTIIFTYYVFDVLMSVDPAEVLLVPVSTLARALGIKVSVGAFTRAPAADGSGGSISIVDSSSSSDKGDIRGSGVMQWGLRCEVEASTFFRLSSAGASDAMGMSMDMVDHVDPPSSAPPTSDVVEAVYRNILCVELDTRLKTMESGALLGGCSTDGLYGTLLFRLHHQASSSSS